ncbi:tRNA (guanine(46)-N(7))-methyltransferase TrmB [Noviherbaspirillum galbum]|uniref:tRNA (guanine(46)-N(7))-methyltransferase n=1 Tax=Noviherbaspirillum galbum TaxID=2709383 RepID=A0A6B3ST52_9BURK|nr:methyltransferase domain-containing protein [Noviherbaspirillum galbum]NEX63831.1 SAM-dependent methyltransferase [Noviherbaspirillum galbum]
MFANSRPIHSKQVDVHEHLHALVARHASSSFRKPIAPYNEAAFESAIAAWRAAGASPLILDAGCGVGLSTRHLAAQYPGHFVIGVDQSADRLARQVAWPGEASANLVLARADLVDFWRLMQRNQISPERQYVLYPNPWPKPAHLSRRWHGHAVFPTVVALGGAFECRSNWKIYIDECAAALEQLTGMAAEVSRWQPDSPMTPFEEKYLASGHDLWRCTIGLPD